MNMIMIPKNSITNLTPLCSKLLPFYKSKIKFNYKLFFLRFINYSGAVNDFNDDFIGDEDIESRNKMFEEVNS